MPILLVLLLSLSFSLGQSPKETDPQNLSRQYELTFRLGESRWKEGNFKEAWRLLNAARELARETGDPEKGVKCLMLLGKLCWSRGRLEDSQGFYSEALQAAQDANLKKEAEESGLALDIWKLYLQGQAELFAGRHEKSVAAFDSALELAGRIGSREHEVKCLRQLGLVHWAREDLENFFSLNERALKLARELNDPKEIVKSLANMGFYYLKLGDYSRALNCYSDALDTSREAESKEDESFCLKNIGLILSQLGFYERSLDYLLEAHEIDRRSANIVFSSRNMINLGEGFRNRGLVFSAKEDLYRALDYLTDALDSAKRNGDKRTELRALNNIGNIHLNLEKYHSAERYFRLAQELAEEAQDGEARLEVLNNLGVCSFETGQVERAQRHFQAALELGSQVGKDKTLWETLFHLGQCYEKKGAVGQALDCYKKSLDAIEYLRSRISLDYYKLGFMKNKSGVHETAVDLLYRSGTEDGGSGRAEELFDIIERAKARAFLETLGEEDGDIRRRLNPSLKQKEDEISGRISAVIRELAKGDLPARRRVDLQKALRRYEDEYHQHISRIRGEAPDFAGVIFPLPIRMEQVQERLLDEKTAILEYFLGEKTSLLFLITKKKWDVLPLPPRREIESSINAYLKLLSDPPKEAWAGALAAQRLSRELLLPALKILPPPVERLIFIPDGLLLYLPFETLDLSSASPSSEEGFLISRYAVSYAPSCSSLLFLKERKGKERYARNLLAFGSPVPPPDTVADGRKRVSVANILRETYESRGLDLSSLPQTDREIKQISSFFSKNSRTVYRHKEASKETLKSISLGDYQIIHFACHAFIDEKLPYRSALVLSWDESSREEGFLQVREIASLRLAAELVVLSACETGRGQVEKGEGILGLTRSLFSSGARSVVSALWKVGDRATAVFMRDFYGHLSQGHDKAQALRLAKLAMSKSKYSHPFYWAPFVLHGESSSRLDVR